MFAASAPRPRNPALSPMPTGTPPTAEERDETHLMLGRGRFAIASSTVYTQSFACPCADLNSKCLAWATFNDYFPGWWRWDWCPGGRPVIGIATWIPAATVAIPTALLLAYLVRTRRYPPGCCPRCGYNLAGLDPAQPCPECGAAALSRPLTRPPRGSRHAAQASPGSAPLAPAHAAHFHTPIHSFLRQKWPPTALFWML